MGGEKPESIPPHGISAVPIFDWRQLKRWNIDEGKLPAGSRLEFKEFTVWEQYKWVILAATAALAFETLLIGFLLYLRMRRKQAVGQIRELHGRLKETVSNVPGVVWETRTDPATRQRVTTFISDSVQNMLGYSAEEWLNKEPGFGLTLVDERDRERVRRESDDAVKTGKGSVSEFRWHT